MAPSGEQVLPVVRVVELPSEELAERWLVEQLWCAQAVGVIGGAPKCAKTWLGLDMALSVATGTPCLGTYAVNASVLAALWPVARPRDLALPRGRQRPAASEGNQPSAPAASPPAIRPGQMPPWDACSVFMGWSGLAG